MNVHMNPLVAHVVVFRAQPYLKAILYAFAPVGRSEVDFVMMQSFGLATEEALFFRL